MLLYKISMYFSYLEVNIPYQYIESITKIHSYRNSYNPVVSWYHFAKFCKAHIQRIDLYLGLDKGF